MAIDFTASNGDPSDPQSLHYMDPRGRPNDYVQAIRAVGQVLEFYDTDKMFPVYGFGGRLNTNLPADHCFALNGNENNPEVPSRTMLQAPFSNFLNILHIDLPPCVQVSGILGVEHCYLAALSRYKLAGPTIFSQIINEVAAKCQGLCTQESQVFFVCGFFLDFLSMMCMSLNVSGILYSPYHHGWRD